MPRDPRGLLRGLSEPWVIPETGVRGWLTPTPLWPSADGSLKNFSKPPVTLGVFLVSIAAATDGQWTVSNIKQLSDDQIRRSQRSAADKALWPLGSALHYQAHESF